jgi:Integrase core domain/Chromo (CHRromatin Organisation MOdifier) domain
LIKKGEKMTDISKQLSEIYYNPENPAAFSTLEILHKAVNGSISKKQIREWLQNQNTYTLHRPKRKRFQRNFYDLDNIGDLWQTDLICWESLAKYNDGFKYILVIIDCFSKFVYTVPLKSKNANEVTNAFKEIFDRVKQTPLRMSSDRGKEFCNKNFKSLMKAHNVRFDVVEDDQNKSCIAERFIRTLSSLIYKYFTYANTFRYIDVLQQLTLSYNNRWHRTIRMAPSEVKDNNILEVYHNIRRNRKLRTKKPKCNVGDHVRISRNKHIFSKNYTPNYSHEVFIIRKVILRKPIVYKLKDLMGEKISGVFYEEEVQKVIFDENAEYFIDKIIETKTKSGRKLALVKWEGWPDKFNSWIDYRLIKKLIRDD